MENKEKNKEERKNLNGEIDNRDEQQKTGK
jgi:hypothetical protein